MLPIIQTLLALPLKIIRPGISSVPAGISPASDSSSAGRVSDEPVAGRGTLTNLVEEPEGSSPVASLKRFDKREFFKTPSASSLLDEASQRASAYPE